MFGLVNVYKDELKIKDYEMFRAYYCGLCKALGKRYNQLVRLGLSYDMTFLAIIADSLSESQPTVNIDGCIKHIGKHRICTSNTAIDFSADMSVILTYHKLKDDVTDENSIKAFLANIPYCRAFRKASEKYPEVSENIKSNLDRLSSLERAQSGSIDEVADTFACLTSAIFSAFDPVLASIGYNIGRFIYIADAYSDIKYDSEHKLYNPYLCMYDPEYINTDNFKHEVMGSLNMTLYAVSEAYRELDIKKNKVILDNIIYMGLRSAYHKIFETTEVTNGKSL